MPKESAEEYKKRRALHEAAKHLKMNFDQDILNIQNDVAAAERAIVRDANALYIATLKPGDYPALGNEKGGFWASKKQRGRMEVEDVENEEMSFKRQKK